MAEAQLNRDYALRFLVVGALMLGMCAWSLFDHFVAWPQKNRDLDRVRPALLATNLTAEAWCEPGPGGVSPLAGAFLAHGSRVPAKLVAKLGELKLPGAPGDQTAMREALGQRVRQTLTGPVYSAHDLQGQLVQAALTLALGLLAFTSVGLKARRRFVADAAGLSGSGFGSTPLAYADIVRIEWTRWETKGIVVIVLLSGRTVKLDGWHFAGVTGIVEEIKRQRPDLAAR
jgi:hypothetical protein